MLAWAGLTLGAPYQRVDNTELVVNKVMMMIIMIMMIMMMLRIRGLTRPSSSSTRWAIQRPTDLGIGPRRSVPQSPRTFKDQPTWATLKAKAIKTRNLVPQVMDSLGPQLDSAIEAALRMLEGNTGASRWDKQTREQRQNKCKSNQDKYH